MFRNGNLECHDATGNEKSVWNGVEIAFAGLCEVIGYEGLDTGLVAQRRMSEWPLRGGRETPIAQQVIVSDAVWINLGY